MSKCLVREHRIMEEKALGTNKTFMKEKHKQPMKPKKQKHTQPIKMKMHKQKRNGMTYQKPKRTKANMNGPPEVLSGLRLHHKICE